MQYTLQYLGESYMWSIEVYSYLLEGCLRAMQRAICWQKVSGVAHGKMRVSSSLEHTALKYGSLPPTKAFKLHRKNNFLHTNILFDSVSE